MFILCLNVRYLHSAGRVLIAIPFRVRPQVRQKIKGVLLVKMACVVSVPLIVRMLKHQDNVLSLS